MGCVKGSSEAQPAYRTPSDAKKCRPVSLVGTPGGTPAIELNSLLDAKMRRKPEFSAPFSDGSLPQVPSVPV